MPQTLPGIGMMFLLLSEGPHSVKEIVAFTQLNEGTVRHWMRSLTRKRTAAGVRRSLRIAHWEKQGRVVVAFYELNTKGLPDAPRPPKEYDAAARGRRHRARQRLGPWAQLAYT